MGFEEELLIIAFVAFVAGFAYAIWRGIKAGRVRREEAARREEARQAALASQLEYTRSIRKLAEIHQAGKAQAAKPATKPATPPRKTEQAKSRYASDDTTPFLPGVGSLPFSHSAPSAESAPYQGLGGSFGGGGASGSWDSSSSSDSGSSSSSSDSSSSSSSSD